MKRSKLAVFYGLFCIPGAIVPWYFNLQHSFAAGALLSPQELIAGGFVTPLASSLTSDFLIGTVPVLVWMAVEARRLKMRNWWAYIVLTFLVAFALSCPLFLMLRELKLRSAADLADLSDRGSMQNGGVQYD
jgi:hypothetical protein